MSRDGKMDMVTFSVFSQRLGASRRTAWREWKRHNPGASWPAFCEAWQAGRAAEELAARYPGLAREGPS